MIHETLCSFGCDRKGNVAIIFALSLVPAVFLIGMALDFSSAIAKTVAAQRRYRRCRARRSDAINDDAVERGSADRSNEYLQR